MVRGRVGRFYSHGPDRDELMRTNNEGGRVSVSLADIRNRGGRVLVVITV